MGPSANCTCRHGRRDFLLKSAALSGALLMPTLAAAAQIRSLQGKVTVDGRPAKLDTLISPGSRVATGAGAKVVFTMGADAFLLRENSQLQIERIGAGPALLVGGLRMLTGALLAVFGKGPRKITTATATIGIRGTGAYVEASRTQTYLCACYGDFEVSDNHGKERSLIFSGYHTPKMIYAQMRDGKMMTGAEVKNHTDDELIMLEALVGRVSPVKERAKLRSQPPEPEAISTPPRSQPMAPAQPPAATQPAPPPAAAPSAATLPATPPAQAPAPSGVTDWRLPPPREFPRR
jgi:hypothetical protein